jgi:HlyD family secretion protein
MTATEQDPRRAIRKFNLAGVAITILLVGGAGGWSATAQMAGAVIAQGTLVVESNVKKVQHPTGGVVGEILVKEGSAVTEGQVVLRLDDTVTRATLGVVRSQLDELMAREARLLAERDAAEGIAFAPGLAKRRDDASVAMALAGEEKLFEARKSARTGQRAQLRERVAQTNEEIRGLSAQLAAKEAELALLAKELAGVTELYQKNLVSISRYMLLQRDQTRLQGERGQLIADIARARGKISETELQIIQLDQDFRSEVLKDLRDAQGKIAELKERVTAAEDQLKRIDLRAPQAGFVHQLAAHTVGGVIGNGEIVMQIVPRAAELVVEAKIAPSDSDQVASPGSSSKIPPSPPSRITSPASRCRRRRWLGSRTFTSFPACRPRSSSRPMSAPRCSICSSRFTSRLRGRSASDEHDDPVSRTSARERAKIRDPGAPRREERNHIAASRLLAPGPRKSGLPDLRHPTADLGQARDRCLIALAQARHCTRDTGN